MNVGLVITPEAEGYLEALVEELTIPPGRYEQAVNRYTSLGDWLHRDASTVKQYDPQVYSQGSFRLGTAIRPENENGQYDIDCVCELRALTKSSLTQSRLKELLGYEIELYRKAQSMLNPLAEGRRCWTLQYADGAQFHLDIVPALPNGADTKVLLERSGLDARWAANAIAITDNEHRNYWIFSDDWPRSNPKGYAAWFKSRMAVIFDRKRRRLAERANASVESIPEHKVLTPLQQAIMILKRHRDTMFSARPKDKPISALPWPVIPTKAKRPSAKRWSLFSQKWTASFRSSIRDTTFRTRQIRSKTSPISGRSIRSDVTRSTSGCRRPASTSTRRRSGAAAN